MRRLLCLSVPLITFLLLNNSAKSQNDSKLATDNISQHKSGFSDKVDASPSDEIFTDISAQLAGVAWSSVAWGDYDNDGDLDILLTGNSGSGYVSKIYRNDAGSFVDIAAPLVGVWESSVAWGDYDNDGDLDILLTGNTSAEDPTPNPVSIIYRNDGGIFVDIPASLVGVFRSSVAWGDYDNDGDLDILLTGESSSGHISTIYRNDGGSFVNISASLIGVNKGSVGWGDYDNDSDFDILLTGDRTNSSSPISKIYRNDSGNFSDISSSIQPVFISSVAWGDYDSDGDLDILLTGANSASTSISKVYQNVGGNFVDISASLTNAYYGSAKWGDYDNDGDFDLLLTGSEAPHIAKVYRNDSGTVVDILATLEGVYTSSVAWGDYDDDGDLDILLTGTGGVAGYNAKIYRNNTAKSNTAPATPANLVASASDDAVTLSWNKSTDNETAQNALTYNLRVGTAPGGTSIVSPMADLATGYRKIPALGNTNHNTRWTIKDLSPGRYYWSVQAIDNAFAGSPFASEQSFVIPEPNDTTPPAAPQNLNATASDWQITLQWQQNSESDFLRYRIYGGTSPNPIVKIDSVNGVSSTSKTITGLANGTRYYFRITAVDVALNESPFSNEASAMPTVLDVPPAPPQNLQTTVGDRQVTLTWSANTELDFLRYRIYGGASPNPTTKIDSVLTLLGTTKVITGLSNGTTYYFRITAVDLVLNESGFSNQVNAAPSAANPPPSPPQNLQATAGTGSVTLSWDANTEPDFLRYRIYGGRIGSITLMDSTEGILNTSKIIASVSNGVTYDFYVTAVDAALQESAASNPVSATPFRDMTAPQIGAPSYSEPVNLNSAVPITVTASDQSGVNNVTLFYRIGGAASFSNSAMSLAFGNTYTQNIPAASATNRGIEFYIQADDAFGNVVSTRRYPIRVICPNGIANPQAQPSGTSASDYRIFSIPLDLDDKTPAAFLNANSALGAPDDKKYRWYAFDRSSRALHEYPDFGSARMTPDMGFPLLVNVANLKLSTGRGTTVNTIAPYNISLPQGWSLIGNPFNFNIPFDSLSVSSGTFELWSFAGDWQINTLGLEAWTGYAVFLSQSTTFSIRAGAAGLNKENSFYSTENNNAANWMIQIIAENGRNASRFNFVGQHEQASDEEDAFDLHQPLRIADQVEVVFNRKNEDAAEQLKADIRQPSESGHVWEFTCLLNPDDEMLSLAFDGVQSLPNGFEAFLFDEDTKTNYDLRGNLRLQFATRRLAEKHFLLIIGAKSFVESQSPEGELHPKDYALLQNFPNPFNPATQIIYSLPKNARVELSVYNIRGEKVATLVNQDQDAGSHTIVWNAAQVGSGIYFIKLEAGGFRMMKKCLLVK